ncbi:MAG TPA: RsmG family class I SAM-dependent methyltransferase [Thermoanaerobaculia bacterium]|jgi:16S rRNA (guanine527-N7)-methyltransferase|nr:RsmG family class I SAM-dependent methyltransferase [Thermoanaerobaculia bacterium]
MPAPLPSFTLALEQFGRALATRSPEPLSPGTVLALHHHYQELALWNRTISLIGPGTAEEVISRHYGESLAALPLIPPGARTAVDIGSGAGFPGIVLAAARPGLEVTLCEARERKWAFLAAASRRASLPCRCLNARVGIPLPTGLPEAIDLVTARAVRLEAEVLEALASRLAPGGRILLWVGEDAPDLPPNLLPGHVLPLAGSDRRRILGLKRGLERAADPNGAP